MSKQRRRCAIYTRKSSEEGLEQDFNSLDAQREACEAYIRSQKGEGWTLLSQRYDDGGISGGTLARPALQRLLVDMAANRVDLIVVYKVDRLTRSLADFAKLVERFDAAGASFVSVTQQFNTATSMGRLTLNVLLSFAQFEREVTAERIRDKIAQSKKKGLWMGGPVPLGYDAKDRSLVINAAEAKTVRTIFQLYLDLGCVRRVKEETDQQGLVSKLHHFKNGRRGGVPLTRGRIYHLLSNPIYCGEIRHKQQLYPGQHQAIIDPATFDAVAAKLRATPRRIRRNGQAAMSVSPLAAKFTDETGDRLTPSHAVSRGRRHRYYVSRRLITESGKGDLSGWRLPAKTLEDAVANSIVERLQHHHATHDLIIDATPEILRRLPNKLVEIATALQGPDRGDTLQAIVDKGRIAPGRLSIVLSPNAFAAHLSLDPEQLKRDALQIESAFTLQRRGVEAKLVMGDNIKAIDPV
ncbi:MAG TPA: recombinase family protein, partial [Kiloniellaceae bacterium]|nr:recombinase family protein [Kiloniellaceae bacterium]